MRPDEGYGLSDSEIIGEVKMGQNIFELRITGSEETSFGEDVCELRMGHSEPLLLLHGLQKLPARLIGVDGDDKGDRLRNLYGFRAR